VETIKRRLILWFMNGRLYNFLMNHVVWRIRFTTYYTNLKGVYYHDSYKILQPADVILTTDDLKLTSILIPGIVDHAAVFVGKNVNFEVVEATHKGVQGCYYADVWKESTRIIIIRCTKWNPLYKFEFINT